MSTQANRLRMNAETNLEVPLHDVGQGKLTVLSGVPRLSIESDAWMSQLLRAHFERPLPQVKAKDGTVQIRYPRTSLRNWLFFWRQPLAELILNPSIPWSIEVQGGVSNFHADLSAMQLTGLNLHGGVSHFWAILPEPFGTATIRVEGGVSQMTIQRPQNIPVRVQVQGAVSSLSVDGQHFGPSGELPPIESPGYGQAVNRYEIQIFGAASQLVIQK
jgi:hypothetical protein